MSQENSKLQKRQVRLILAHKEITLAALAIKAGVKPSQMYNTFHRYCGQKNAVVSGRQTKRALTALARAAGAAFFPPLKPTAQKKARAADTAQACTTSQL